jgi:prolyl oligopeptidase
MIHISKNIGLVNYWPKSLAWFGWLAVPFDAQNYKQEFMTRFCLFLSMLTVVACEQTQPPKSSNSSMEFKKIPVTYPFSKKDTTIENTYFGTKIKDPYRWLEDDQSPETKDWVQKQNLVTNGYLSQIPFRDRVKKRLEQIWNFEKYSVPFKRANRYFFFKNDGLQNQSVLYTQETLDSQPLAILDPNQFSKDGTASLQEFSISKNGQYIAYAVSEGGSDWRTIKVKNLLTGAMDNFEVKWAKFTTIAWHDNGFYYSRYPEPQKGDELKAANQRSAIWYHKLGEDQSKDQKIHDDPAQPNLYFGAGTTLDERFLLLQSSESTSGNTLSFKDLSKNQAEFTPLFSDFKSEVSVIGNLGTQLLVLTSHNAPNQQVLLIDAEQPDPKNWRSLIPNNPTDVLQHAEVCGDKIVCSYLHDASSALRVFDLNGTFLKEIKLPEIGTIGNLEGEEKESLAFFSFQSFLRPNTIFALDMNTLEYRPFKSPKLDFDPSAFVTEQIWYTSKDGTKVPMFVNRRKNIAKDGTNPTLLYGYGGFNVPVSPAFSASRAALLENNGIYVVANIRGGGEFGETWHKAGTVLQKQNVFDDFIAAAEYLVANKYTSPERLAIEGGSNGGLLVGACMTQRPELFGVCFPRVGVLDMLRYHQFTIGYAWAADYGRSDANEPEFKYLLGYSPLHNVRKIKYPSTMITTADHDDRVVPAHSFKFAATLQEMQQGDRPTLIRIETSAGHGAGKPTAKLLEEAADMLSFMLYEMKVAAN